MKIDDSVTVPPFLSNRGMGHCLSHYDLLKNHNRNNRSFDDFKLVHEIAGNYRIFYLEHAAKLSVVMSSELAWNVPS